MNARDWCERYRALGWKVLRVHRDSKAPIGKGWQHAPSIEPEDVVEDDEPLGVQGGAGSGLLVLDADDKEAAGKLADELAALGADTRAIPIQKTARGFHFFFAWPAEWPDGRSIRGKFDDKIDIIGTNRQVNVVPSPGKEWINGPCAPPELPEQLKRYIEKNALAAPTNLVPPDAHVAHVATVFAKRKIEINADGTSSLVKLACLAIRGYQIYTPDAWLSVVRPLNAKLEEPFDDEELLARWVDAFSTFETEEVEARGAVYAPLEIADEVHAAERLVFYLEEEGPHVADLGTIWRYDERGVWIERSADEMINYVAERMKAHATYGRPLVLNAPRVEGIRKLAQARLTRAGFFDDAPCGVAVRNGFLTERDGRVVLVEHAPENRCRHALELDYVPGRKDELWEDFLSTTLAGLPGQETWIQLLKQFTGAALFGRATECGQMLILAGDGQNGKSVFLEAIARLFPAEVRTAVPLQRLETETYLAKLRNSAINIVNELPATTMLETGNAKSVITGEEVTARDLFKAPFEFRPRGAHIASCNELPSVKDVSHGWRRRVVVVPFRNEFERNEGYKARVVERTAGVLTWAVEGYQELLDKGRLALPEVRADEQVEWETESDVVAAWLQTMHRDPCVAGMKGETAFNMFKLWALENSRAILGSGRFFRRLKKLAGTRVLDGYTLYLIEPKTGANVIPIRG